MTDLTDLLEDIHSCLEHSDALVDVEDLENKMVALSLYIEEEKGEDKRNLVLLYNKLADSVGRLGLSVKHYEAEAEADAEQEPAESEVFRRRLGAPSPGGKAEDRSGSPRMSKAAGDDEVSSISLSILEQSRELKKKSELFGQLTDESKSLIDGVSSSIRRNVTDLHKKVASLEQKEWWKLGRFDVLWVVLLVLVLFVGMYVFIRIS